MAHEICISGNNGYRHSLKYVNTYCFFTAIVFTRTRLRLTFIGMPVVLLTWGVYGDFFSPFQKLNCRVPGSVLCSSLTSAVLYHWRAVLFLYRLYLAKFLEFSV